MFCNDIILLFHKHKQNKSVNSLLLLSCHNKVINGVISKNVKSINSVIIANLTNFLSCVKAPIKKIV